MNKGIINLSLILAAPDMLEALRAVLGYFNDVNSKEFTKKKVLAAIEKTQEERRNSAWVDEPLVCGVFAQNGSTQHYAACEFESPEDMDRVIYEAARVVANKMKGDPRLREGWVCNSKRI